MKKDFTARIVTLSEVYAASYRLANMLKQSPYTFDVIIAIARGGFPGARFVCDFLNIRSLYSMQVTHYAGGAKHKEKTEIKAPVNVDVKGKNVLIIDDVNDSGETLQAAHNYLQSLQPNLFKIAVLHEKQGTKFKADFAAHYQKKWKWLIYQWAVTEDVLSFLHKDNMLEAKEEAAHEHLLKKYDLKISKRLLRNILKMKDSYF